MKKFRLQAILEYRKSLEEEAQREFSEIHKTLDAENKLVSEIHNQRLAWQQKLREKQLSGLCPAEIDLHQKFLHFLTIKATKQKEKIQALELAVETKRQALLEAVKEKRVMERLKEKTLQLQEKERLQEEQKILDERALIPDEN